MSVEKLSCWNCGQENPAGAKFCLSCGKPLRQACPECGAPVPEGAKFCANCGIPLGGGAKAPAESGPILTAEARKVITAVFADLVGSTGLTERLDPEEARQVMGEFYGVMRGAVERFEGAVANTLGDAVLVVFGFPTSHEDDPERAVRAGLAMRDAMPGLNDRLEARFGVRLSVRVGVNTGEAVATSGSVFDRDFLVSDAVTTAARLQQTIAPGLVVVGERTHRLTQTAITYRELPPLEVKGKAAPLRVWEAVAPSAQPLDGGRAVAPLIGRQGELGLLRGFYQRCRDESLVHLITVLGQPGVGKSRLLREFLAEVHNGDQPPLMLRGRSVAFGGQIGYHALIDILGQQAGLLDTDAPEIVREKLAKWLRETLPGHDHLLEGLQLTFGTTAQTQVDPGQLRRQLLEAWSELFTTLAAGRPVIVAFEDTHWADEGVLDLVEWICETVETAPLFLVCLARPELLERRPTWASTARNGTRIDLKPLRPQEADLLVAALSSQGLVPEVRQAITERTEGNPFFVEELVQMLMEGSGAGAAIPDTVQAVITARIDRLPAEERRVLQAAAVIGRSFRPPAVAALAEMSEPDTVRALEGLVRKQMVSPRPQTASGLSEYAFRHILTRDVAYGLLPKSQRARAHAEAARWLEAQMGDRIEEVIEIVAEHLRQAGDDARAVPALTRAANKARRQYANADAIRLFDQADEAAARAGLPLRERVPIYQGRGDVREHMGDYALALSDFERGLAAARDAGEPAVESELESRVGLIYHRQMKLNEAEPHFQRAVALARQEGNPLTLGSSLAHLANIAWDRGRLEPEDERLTEAVVQLRKAQNPASLARGLNLLCMARFAAGDAPGAIAAAQEALACAREAGDKSREATSLSYLAIVHTFWGRFRDGLRFGREASALAQQIGDRRRIAFADSFVVWALIFLGEWGEGIRIGEKALPMVREYARIHLPFAYLGLTRIYDELGDAGRAGRVVGSGADIETVHPHPAWREAALVAQLLLSRLYRDSKRLNEILDEILSSPVGLFIADDAEFMLPVGEALVEAERIDDLRGFMAKRWAAAEKFGALHHQVALDILDARLAANAGLLDEALGRLRHGLAMSRQAEDVIMQRRVLELLVSLQDAPEDRSELRSLLQRLATSLPEDLAATFLASPRAAVLRS